MCGRYYVDDETAREIERLVRKIDQELNATSGRDVIPLKKRLFLQVNKRN